MSGQAGSDHAAVECMERRQERRRGVALVVVRHRLAASLLERQAGLRAIESLDLRFFGAGEDQRAFWRREVESDDIVECCGATGVVAELESVDAMRFAARGAPDAAHGRGADAGLLGALVRRLQWVTLGGFCRVVLRMISNPLSAPTAPAWTKRFRQRATNWREVDTCCAICLFCRPAAASRTILARSARRTATRRPRAYPFNCLRWVSVSVTRGAVRISSSYQMKTLRTTYK